MSSKLIFANQDTTSVNIYDIKEGTFYKRGSGVYLRCDDGCISFEVDKDGNILCSEMYMFEQLPEAHLEDELCFPAKSSQIYIEW